MYNNWIKGLMLIVGLISSTSLIGQIEISEEPMVRQLMDRFVKLGKEEPYIEGWRIKIISTTSRREMENARWLFRQIYPDLQYTLNHESPHYSLIVGAFENRIDVEPMLNQFKKDFPKAIPYRDRIMETELFMKDGF